MNDDPLRWLFSLEVLGMKFGLENMTSLLAELGQPHLQFPSIHIAGTNGKGSVTAMTDSALRRAGYRSARYTSPHLVRVEERFVIDGAEVETSDLRNALARVRDAVESLSARGVFVAPPTFFECSTAAAFELFRAAAVDIAVLEAGLGGRLDATNVVQPVATAITTIDLDHQAQLGSTIEQIAAEKAGIIKAGVPVVLGELVPEAERVVAAAADAVGAPVVLARQHGAVSRRPLLAGAHQVANAAVAAALLRTIRDRGFPIDDQAIDEGISQAEWPGRLERFRYGAAEVLLDAAHNPAGARALSEHLREIGWSGATLVFAAMADKDARGMLAALLPQVGRVICTTAPTPRAAAARDLAALALSIDAGALVESIDEPAAALSRACEVSPRVIAAGSMFLIGPLRGILR